MAAKYSCLLFDVDGTLLDFDAAERQAIEGSLHSAGLPCGDKECASFSAINAALWKQLENGEIKKERLVVQRFKSLLQQLGATGDAIRLNNDYMTRLSQGAAIIPGADELLAELAEFATLAVVSNGSYKVQMERLKKSGLLPYFDDVFVSEKVGAAKPAPKIFYEALKQLGVQNKSRVLMVGNSLSADIKGGANAGIHTCWCNFKNEEASTVQSPTYTVQNFAQLKVVAIGEEELKNAANREKRHTV